MMFGQARIWVALTELTTMISDLAKVVRSHRLKATALEIEIIKMDQRLRELEASTAHDREIERRCQ
jgi:hypothetical protein